MSRGSDDFGIMAKQVNYGVGVSEFDLQSIFELILSGKEWTSLYPH